MTTGAPDPDGTESPALDVTVIVPAHNAEAYVSEALDSVLGQTHPPAQVVVVDDGSTDGTAEILSAYDGRVDVLSVVNGGVARARNLGVAAARHAWIAFLDADDVWLASRLRRMAQAAQAEPEVGLVYCGLTVVDSDLQPIAQVEAPPEDRALRNTLLLEPPAVSVAQAALIRKAAFEAVGGFDEVMSTSADSDLVVRLLSRYAARAVPEQLVLYRQHGDQMSSDVGAMQRDMRRCHAKAAADCELPSDLRPLLRRGRANLHLAIGGELLRRGARSRGLRHVLAAAAADPARTAAVLTRRARRAVTV